MDGLFWGGLSGNLEVRAEHNGSARLKGAFPYHVRTVLSDGGQFGRLQKEEFAGGAFARRVSDPNAEIHLLVAHSFDKPLARKLDASLILRDGETALEFEAFIAPEITQTTHGRDVMALLSAGLATGVSPGFRITHSDDEEVIDEQDGEERAVVRRIKHAELHELSIVTRPAYPMAQVEARNWKPGASRRSIPNEFYRRWRV